nr:phosphoprotein ECPP44 [Malus domestica]
MEDQYPKESQTHAKGAEEEAQGCGMFDFLKKKDNQKPHQEQEQHKHTTLAEKLHHHDGDSSSSSSDEEGGEKKKKGLKGKIKDKISSNKEGGDACHASVPATNGHADEKGFVEKTKDKLPGQHKEAEHVAEEKGFVEKIKKSFRERTRRLNIMLLRSIMLRMGIPTTARQRKGSWRRLRTSSLGVTRPKRRSTRRISMHDAANKRCCGFDVCL